MIRSLYALAISLVCLAQAALAQLPTAIVGVDTGEAAHSFTVEVAATPEAITAGLMFRTELGPDQGMLFDFGGERPASMWMKNTLIPLDMLFIDGSGMIVSIARNAVPGSLRSLGPGIPVRGVLEIAGGRAEALSIEPGDQVIHPIFGPAGG